MLAAKKRILFRTCLVIVLILAILAPSFIISAVDSNGYRKLLSFVETTGFDSDSTTAGDPADPAGFSELQLGFGMTKVAENQEMALFLNDNLQGISLYDKQAGIAYHSLIDQTAPAYQSAPESVQGTMASMISLNYIDLSSSDSPEKSVWSATEDCTAVSEPILNGVRVTYDFTSLNLKVAVEFLLEGDHFTVRVPDSGFEEQEPIGAESDVISKKIEESAAAVRAACKAAQSALAGGDYSENMRNLIELTVNDIDKFMAEIDQETAIGIASQTKLDLLKDYADRLVLLTGSSEAAQASLNGFLDQVAAYTENTLKLVKARATGVTAITVIPYFGAQFFGTDGYAFYPDKNGAISYFNRLHSGVAGSFQQDVYGELTPESSAYDYETTVYMPVYGIKNGNGAFLAIIDQGDFDSSITFNPCSGENSLANIYAQYRVRNKTVDVNSNGWQTESFDRKRIPGDRQTCYYLLRGDQANYSGIAVRYREYLEQKGLLTRSSILDREMPLGLEYYIGKKSDRQSLFREYLLMTGFSDIEKHLTALKEGGVANADVLLTNWQKDGALATDQNFAPAKEAGGEKGLKRLTALAKQNGYAIGLDGNLIWAQRDEMSSAMIETVTVKSISQLSYEKFGYHLLNPFYVVNNFLKNGVAKLERYGVDYVQSYSAGDYLYFDYNADPAMDRSKTASVYNKLASETKAQLGRNNGTMSGVYALKELDYLRNVSEIDSRHIFTDENVPFYQMLLHGSKVYSGESFNLMHNRKEQELLAIEYGYLPHYILTERAPDVMRTEGYGDFFSGQIETQTPDVIETYQRYQADFKEIWNKKMIRHSREGLVGITEYEGGYTVYTNRSGETYPVGNQAVVAGDYLVVKG